MTLASLAIGIHVLFVFWLVAGILGRDQCSRRARKTEDLARLEGLIELASHFERAMVRPGTGGTLITGLLAAWARGWPILGFLQGANVNWVLTALLVYLSIIPVIVFVFVPRGKVFRAALEEAKSLGRVTPALRTAMADPVVAAGHVYELTMIVLLTGIMVTRAF